MKLASPFSVDFDVEIVNGTLQPGDYDVSLAYLGYDHDSKWEYTLGLPSTIKKVHLDSLGGIIINLRDKCNKDAIGIGVIINNVLSIVHPPESLRIGVVRQFRSAPISCKHGSRVPYTEPRKNEIY